MRRKKKRRYTVTKPFTPFERTKTKDILSLLKMGVNPMEVKIVSIGGESSYHTADMCNMFEMTGRKFDIIATSLERKKGEPDERRPLE